MATLTQDDLNSINTLFTKNFETIWKDNLAPAIDDIVTKNDVKNIVREEINNAGVATKNDVKDSIREEVQDIVHEEINKAGIATKKDINDARDYIDNKIAEYSGKSVARDHGLEQRIELTDTKLAGKNIFTPQDLQDIKTVPVFDPTNA